MSKLRTDFKDEILQEGETHRVYNIKRKGTDEVVESEVYLEKAYEALQEGNEFGAKDVNEIHVRLNGLASMNLLINSDFRNPINQRGKTSYSGKNIYTIDRWRMYNGTLDVLDGYIKFTNNGDDYTTLTQVLENTLPENDYVLSFKIKSVTGTIEVYANINNTGVLVGTISENTSEFVFDFNSPTLNMIWISLPIGASIELEYIKLEQGSIATPLVPRPYSEELALCQRYYIPIFSYQGSYPFRGDDKYISIFLPRIMMRTNPTVTGGKIVFAGVTIDGYVVSLQEASTVIGAYERDHGVEITFAQATKVVNFGTASIVTTMELDAEIY